jgi:hypothetical protein
MTPRPVKLALAGGQTYTSGVAYLTYSVGR